MKWWNKFWKLRKQKDVVKIMLLYFVIGMGFMANAVYHGILLYRIVQSPAEYVVAKIAGSAVTETELEEIRRLEYVIAASRQQEEPVTVKYQMKEADFSCILLSESYLETAYGIRKNGAMKTFYMNRKAYEQLMQRTGSGGEELVVSYVMESLAEGDEGQKGGTAKAVLVTAGIPEEEPVVFCRGDSAELTGDVAELRVRVGRQELDGGNVRRLENLGYSVVNREEIREAEYLRELELVRIQYGAAVGGICLVSVWVLWRFGNV